MVFKLSSLPDTSILNVSGDTYELMDTKAEWDKIASTMSFAFGSAEEKARIAEDFVNKYKYGKAIINQYEGPSRSSIENLWNLTKESFRSVKAATQLADDVVTGNIDQESYKIIADTLKRQAEQYTPEPLKEVQNTFQKMSERYDKAKGVGETLSAVGSNIFNTLAEVIRHPEGVLQLAAQSSGTMAPIMSGALAGSQVASAVAPTPISPVVGAIGSMLGQFSGEMATEMGYRLIQEAQEELQRQGLKATEVNFEQIFQDDAWKKTALKKARLKAAGTALTDTLLAVGAGKIASSLERKAAAAGKAVTAAGAEKSVLTANIARELAKITKGQKLAQHLKAIGAEMISEPVSELAGQLAAGDKIQTGELAGEFLGGLGSSVAMASVDKALYATKLAAAATAATGKVAKDTLQNARIKAGYAAKVTEALKTGETAKYSDIRSEDFDPVIAIDIIRKKIKDKQTTKPKHLVYLKDAVKLRKDGYTKLNEQAIRLNELVEKINNKSATQEEVAEYDTLDVKATDLEQAMKVVDKTLVALTPAGQTDLATQSTAQIAEETENSEVITETIHKIIGSKNQGSDILDFMNLSKIANNENLDKDTRILAAAVEKQITQRKKLEKGKSTADVRHDVFHNFGDFKGIDYYMHKITTALNTEDAKGAEQALKQLVKFRNRHAEKADTFEQAVANVTRGTKMSPEAIKHLEHLHEIRKSTAADGEGYNINKGAFVQGVLKPVQQEVVALNASVNLADSLIKTKGLTHKVDIAPPINTALQKQDITAEKSKSTSTNSIELDSATISNISGNKEIFDEVNNGEVYQGKFTKRYERLPKATTLKAVRSQIDMLEQDIEVNQDALTNIDKTDTEQIKEGQRILAKQKRKKRLLIKQEASIIQGESAQNVEKTENKSEIQKEKEASSESKTTAKTATIAEDIIVTINTPGTKEKIETVNAAQELKNIEEELDIYKRLLRCVKG